MRMAHHDDLQFQSFGRVLLRVAIAYVKMDVKKRRACYIDNTGEALLALRGRLEDSGLIMLSSNLSLIHMMHLSGVKLSDMDMHIFGNHKAPPPYSKYGGRAGVPVRKSSSKSSQNPTFHQSVLPMGEECLDS